MLNKLHLNDCLSVMEGIPDNSLDAIITDPPYYTTALKFDKQPKIDFQAFFKAAHRICKPTAPIICFSQQPFTTHLINSNFKYYRCEWIWEKSCAMGFLNAKKRPLRAHENIIVFSEKGWHTYNPQKTRVHSKPPRVRKAGAVVTQHYNQKRVDGIDDGTRYPRSVVKYRNVSRSWDKTAFHPTQKPLELIEMLVRTYSNPGDTVFDPFAGSATTAIASIRNQRNFICVESNPDYHAKAQKRIGIELAQDALAA